jgi:undecaprenyl-diphosphatase
MFEQLNLLLFSSLNAEAGLTGWRLQAGVFAAEWLIFLVPTLLVLLWISGEATQRQAAVRASLAAAGALAINGMAGLLWFHPRPFMAGVGHTFMHHASDSSFPSDHATILFTVALVLAFNAAPQVRKYGTMLLPIAVMVAWSRVFLGVHYPMDMIGALVVSSMVTLLFCSRLGGGACAALLPLLEALYRRLLAAPIARGWLRP